MKNHPRPGSNLILNIDWTGASFNTKLPKTGAKLNNHNRQDPLDRASISINSNHRDRGKSRILRIDLTGAKLLVPNNPKLMQNHIRNSFPKNKLDRDCARY